MRRSISSAALCLLLAAVCAAADSQLASAIKAGDRQHALAMIASGADVNAAQPDGTTALHWAVYRQDTELVRTLLAHGANPKVVNTFGSTPLAEAIKVTNLELVAMLLKGGADVESANDDGETALMLAARNGSLPIAELLVRHGAKVNARERWRGQTALMWAAAERQPEVTELLLAHGAQVNARAFATDWGNQITSEPRAQYRPTGGLTPLLYAARSGCERCAQAMIKAGADINLPNPDGITPLMTAIDNLHFDLAKYLLERGANPHTWDWWGRTPLYVAVDMHSYPNSRGSFNGPRVRVELTDKTTALDVIKLLLAAGVNPNPQLDMHRPGRGGNSARFVENLLTTGATPLLRAAVAQDPEACQVLLEHGALVDLPNAMGVTPLMAAAGLGISPNDPRPLFDDDMQARALATLEVLVKAGADVNARIVDTSSHTARIARPSTMTDRQGQTAIYGPINWSWTRVAQFLIDHGARVDVVDASGRTPLNTLTSDIARRDAKAAEEMTALIKSASAGSKPESAAHVAPSG
jgi:ankyrin repeat protein